MPTFVSQASTVVAAAGTTGIVATAPGSIVVGNLLLACIMINSSSVSLATLSGWTAVRSGVTSGGGGTLDVSLQTLSRIATAADVGAASYSFAWSSSGTEAGCAILQYSGFPVTSFAPGIDAAGTVNGSSTADTTVTTNAATTTRLNDEIIMIAAAVAATAPTVTANGSYVSRSNFSTATILTMDVADALQAAVGTTGTPSATCSTARHAGLLLASGGSSDDGASLMDSGHQSVSPGAAADATFKQTPDVGFSAAADMSLMDSGHQSVSPGAAADATFKQTPDVGFSMPQDESLPTESAGSFTAGLPVGTLYKMTGWFAGSPQSWKATTPATGTIVNPDTGNTVTSVTYERLR